MTSLSYELSVMYEISSLPVQPREGKIMELVIEKIVRLFRVKRCAIILFSRKKKSKSLMYGFRDGSEIKKMVKKKSKFTFSFSLGEKKEIGLLYVEKSIPLSLKERKFLEILGGRLNEILVMKKIEALSRRQIEKEKEKLEVILRNIGDGICMIDHDEKILMTNKSAEILCNKKSEEMIGEELYQFFLCNDKRKRTHAKCTQWKKGEIINLNNINLHPVNSEVMPVSFNITPIKDTQGRIRNAIVTFRDLTEERKMDQMKSEFTGIASHHLRTPLTIMRWYLEMFKKGVLGKIPRRQAYALGKITKAHDRMLCLVNDLLNVSKIEAGHFELKPEKIQLEDIILKSEKNIQNIVKKKNIRLIIPKFKKRLPYIHVDSLRIREAIQHLMKNAVDYCEKGKSIKISYKFYTDKKFVIFSIKDNGYGISPKNQKQIFAKFIRSSNKTVGTGLGLYIAKNIIELSGGKIWFQSEEGRGSAFHFILPVVTK